MKTTPAFLCFFLSLAAIHAEPAKARVPGETTSVVPAATLKERLVKSLREDMKAIGDTDERKTSSLSKFISILENEQLTGTYESSSNERLDYYTRSGGVSEKSATLCADFLKQQKEEAFAAKKKITEELIQSARAALKSAMAAKSAEEIKSILVEVQKFSNQINQMNSRSGSSEYQGHFYKLISTVEQLANLRRYDTNEGWSEVANLHAQIERNLREISIFISPDEVKTCMDQLRQRAGLPVPAELPRILQELTDQLLDDSKQDLLDEIVGKIRNYQSLTNSSSSSAYYSRVGATRWQALYSFASTFVQGVRQVKNGGVFQFSPDRYMREESEMKSLISSQDLLKRVRNYKVKVDDGNGNITTERMYVDVKEVLERIQTLEDVRRELPALKKAQRYQSSSSDGNEWSQVVSSLEYLASIVTKLESGDAFNLGIENMAGYSEARRYPAPATDHPSAGKLTALNEQMQRMILRRFYPEISKDEKSAPSRIIASLFEKHKTAKAYRELPVLNQITQFFNPGQPLLTYQEIAAINLYLAGLRQDEELMEPRLATYYFQRSAAIHSRIIPLEELKSRLHRLKKDFPADYEKGIDDTFKANPDDANARYLQSQFIVPASK